MTDNVHDHVDVLVIGAGQAGLAIAHLLNESGVRFTVLERQSRIGDSWRQRYDSLVLFSSRAFSALPDFPLNGDPNGYPDKNEIADYLERYARVTRLPIELNERVTALKRTDRGFTMQTASGRQITATSVIVAAGPFQRAIVPVFARRLASDVQQFDGTSYRNSPQLAPGRILVVGDGPTGRQISLELARTHQVWLSAGSFRLVVPQRFLGRDIIAWFETTGALRDDKESLHGRFVQLFDPIPGWHLRRSALRRAGVKIVPRAIDAVDQTVTFTGGQSQDFDAVIWAIGYHDDSSWLRIPGAVDAKGNYLEQRGISPIPGLFHIGRNWQNNRASALLTGVGNDVPEIAAQAVEFVQAQTAPA